MYKGFRELFPKVRRVRCCMLEVRYLPTYLPEYLPVRIFELSLCSTYIYLTIHKSVYIYIYMTKRAEVANIWSYLITIPNAEFVITRFAYTQSGPQPPNPSLIPLLNFFLSFFFFLFSLKFLPG